MRHAKAGQETIETLQIRKPEKITVDGQMYLCFRDVFWNQILNQLKNVDFNDINKKIHTVTTQPMSHKHRKRLVRQLKKSTGMR